MLAKIIDFLYKAGDKLLAAHCSDSEITVKPGEANFVTAHDIAMQEYIKESMLELFPNAAFMGEESGENTFKDSRFCIITDPIDGTTNFIKNYKHSCISIAILKDSRPYLAAVYNPYLKDMFCAEAGKGAFYNGEKLKLSDVGLKDSLIAFGTCPYYAELFNKTMDDIIKLFPHCADIRRTGSAALDICYVASGKTALFFEHLLSPWDFAAASLILTEAGGVISAGKEEFTFEHAIPIVAATPKAYEEYIKIIKQ